MKQISLKDKWKDPPEIVTKPEEIQTVKETLEILTGKRKLEVKVAIPKRT